jgi:hypothetical protein
MTLADLRRHVSAHASLDNTLASDEQLLMDDWANEGVQQVLLDLGIHVVTSTFAVTSGVGDYAWPFSTTIMLHRIWALDNSLPVTLEPISPEEILVLRRSAGSAPVRYYAFEGDLFMIYPTPTANGLLQISYTPMPTILRASPRGASPRSTTT